jgi:hypothetical protein
LLAATTANNVLLIPTPVDHVSWTPEVAEFVQRDDLAGQQPVVLCTGTLSALAQKELTARGWKFVKP